MAKKNNEENTNRKKIILICIIVIAFIISIIFIVMTIKKDNKQEEFKIDGIEITKNKDIIQDIKVDELEITNQILYNRNNESVFSAIVNNNTSEDFHIRELYIVVDENRILVLKNTKILANNKQPFEISFDIDVLDTSKIDYELFK